MEWHIVVFFDILATLDLARIYESLINILFYFFLFLMISMYFITTTHIDIEQASPSSSTTIIWTPILCGRCLAMSRFLIR